MMGTYCLKASVVRVALMSCHPRNVKVSMGMNGPVFKQRACLETWRETHPFLLHELAIGAIVNDVASEDRSGQGTVDLFSVDVLGLAVQDELVALGADVDGGLLAEEDKGKDVAELHRRSNQ